MWVNFAVPLLLNAALQQLTGDATSNDKGGRVLWSDTGAGRCRLALSAAAGVSPTACATFCAANAAYFFDNYAAVLERTGCRGAVLILEGTEVSPEAGSCVSQHVWGAPRADLRGAASEVGSLTECQQECFDEPSCVYWNVFNVAGQATDTAPEPLACALKSAEMLTANRGPQCENFPSGKRCGPDAMCVAEVATAVGAPRVCAAAPDVCNVPTNAPPGAAALAAAPAALTAPTAPPTAPAALAAVAAPTAPPTAPPPPTPSTAPPPPVGAVPHITFSPSLALAGSAVGAAAALLACTYYCGRLNAARCEESGAPERLTLPA